MLLRAPKETSGVAQRTCSSSLPSLPPQPTMTVSLCFWPCGQHSPVPPGWPCLPSFSTCTWASGNAEPTLPYCPVGKTRIYPNSFLDEAHFSSCYQYFLTLNLTFFFFFSMNDREISLVSKEIPFPTQRACVLTLSFWQNNQSWLTLWGTYCPVHVFFTISPPVEELYSSSCHP